MEVKSKVQIPVKTRLDVTDELNPVIYLATMGGACAVWTDRTDRLLKLCPVSAILTTMALVGSVLHVLVVPSAVLYVQKYKSLPHYENSTPTITVSTVTSFSATELVTKLMNPVSVSLSAITVRVLALVRMPSALPRILHTLRGVDLRLATPHHPLLDRSVRGVRLAALLLLLLTGPFQAYSVWEENPFIMLVFSINAYNNFSVACLDLQHCVLCHMIRTRFQALHGRLHALETMLARHAQLQEASPTVVLSHAGTGTGTGNGSGNDNGNRSGMADEVGACRRLHEELAAACTELNGCHGAHLLVSSLSCCLNALLNVYYTMYGGLGRHRVHTMDVVHSVLWGSHYLLRFLCLCTLTDTLVNEANHTKVIISKMINRKFDKAAKEELWIFLTYGLTKKITFTACGLFRIHFPLITAAVATGTTYLVILAQFHHGNC